MSADAFTSDSLPTARRTLRLGNWCLRDATALPPQRELPLALVTSTQCDTGHDFSLLPAWRAPCAPWQLRWMRAPPGCLRPIEEAAGKPCNESRVNRNHFARIFAFSARSTHRSVSILMKRAKSSGVLCGAGSYPAVSRRLRRSASSRPS
jgi:hypothetical protein